MMKLDLPINGTQSRSLTGDLWVCYFEKRFSFGAKEKALELKSCLNYEGGGSNKIPISFWTHCNTSFYEATESNNVLIDN